uniref:Secreted protein n=1 Tax=Oryza sativa subsp. japonica TaxID=39947 RepID=Q69IK2_ORYSJ|nr:unknown protein [Oryza sativa Japonica Group]BAD36718.1 unknown protein [Oryza sativa Japonica Group]BAD36722.1 unknown protein [Oryza sativa Japonica Group]BAD36728.1 unknown protein [Oryza sativa Japonica Group]
MEYISCVFTIIWFSSFTQQCCYFYCCFPPWKKHGSSREVFICFSCDQLICRFGSKVCFRNQVMKKKTIWLGMSIGWFIQVS